MMKFSIIILGMLAGIASGAPALMFEQTDSAWKALRQNKNQVVRRSAYVKLASLESEREAVWKWALTSSDPVLRRDAVRASFRFRGETAATWMKEMAVEKDPDVQSALREVAFQVRDQELKKELQRLIAHTPPTNEGTGELFRLNLRLRDDPNWDHEVETIQVLPLPVDGWRFATDGGNIGLKQRFFAGEFDDFKWKLLRTDSCWEVQGIGDYDGFAWYRLRFTLPSKPDCNGAEFYFPLVDEDAWVWLNGIYLGQRVEGPKSWDKPFYLDVSKELRWGEENLLVVRVFDSEKAGGICRPVKLHVLK